MEKRIIGMFLILCLSLSLLYVRIEAVISKDKLSFAAQTQNTYTLQVSATRAPVYDRNLKKLTNTVRQKKAAIVPREADTAFLESISEEKRTEVAELMTSGTPFLQNVQDDFPEHSGVRLFDTYLRYDEKGLARHIIGYLDYNGHGVSGIEKAFDDFFTENTRKVSVSYNVNAWGKLLGSAENEVRISGGGEKGLVLTIDSAIQQIVEETGEKSIKKGSVVVMDPHTGELLASASFPQFSRENPDDSLSDPNSPYINRAFTAFCVGSTFKVAIAAAALESGVPEQTAFSCAGHFELGGLNFGCHRAGGHGSISLQDGLMQSCNPYFIQIGQRLGFQTLRTAALRLGFGKGTEFADNYGSAAGYVPSANDIVTAGDLANFSFGQGKLMATPVQLASMISAVVNSGKCPQPVLVKGITSEDGQKLAEMMNEPKFTQAFSAKTAEKLKEYLVKAVSQGTGTPARPTFQTAGGKTGSAQTGQFDGEREMLNALFAGFYPAENPQYSIVVLCEDGISGSGIAGPIFKEICDRIEALKAI